MEAGKVKSADWKWTKSIKKSQDAKLWFQPQLVGRVFCKWKLYRRILVKIVAVLLPNRKIIF